MRIHILGHSDSKLEGGAADWPVLLRGLLQQELGEPVDVSGSRLAPYGPKAVGYAVRRVHEAAPDTVLLSVSAFSCTVGLVYPKVGERFGKRAQRGYEGAERLYSRFTAKGPAEDISPDRLVSRIARKLIGTATLATVEEVGRVYAEILHELARVEQVQVVVMGESFFSRRLQLANPGMLERIALLRSIVRPAADAHRFPWVDIEAAFSATADREQHYLPDGVHNSAAGHLRVAATLAQALIGLAPVAAEHA